MWKKKYCDSENRNINISDSENYNIVTTTNLVNSSIGKNRGNLSNFLNNEYVNIYVTWYRLYNFFLALASLRWNSLNFIDDLYVLFLRKIGAFNPLSSYDSISNFEDYINHYIYFFMYLNFMYFLKNNIIK